MAEKCWVTFETRIHRDILAWMRTLGISPTLTAALLQSFEDYKFSSMPPREDLPPPTQREPLITLIPIEVASCLRRWARHHGVPQAAIARAVLSKAYQREGVAHASANQAHP